MSNSNDPRSSIPLIPQAYMQALREEASRVNSMAGSTGQTAAVDDQPDHTITPEALAERLREAGLEETLTRLKITGSSSEEDEILSVEEFTARLREAGMEDILSRLKITASNPEEDEILSVEEFTTRLREAGLEEPLNRLNLNLPDSKDQQPTRTLGNILTKQVHGSTDLPHETDPTAGSTRARHTPGR